MKPSRPRLLLGDCLDRMAEIESESVDAVVTDPPAGIGFMGKAWDGPRGGRDAWIAWLRVRMAEALRIAKPGSYALVWALPRTSHWTATAIEDAGWQIRDTIAHFFGTGFPKAGSCLKPGREDWILALKPAKKVPPLQIDACRIGSAGGTKAVDFGPRWQGVGDDRGHARNKIEAIPLGRWPANVVLDEDVAAELDRMSGVTRSSGGINNQGLTGSIYGNFRGVDSATNAGGLGDVGGASRFFYVAKASRSDRGQGNDHPTVKSTDLMRWLCRLITPPGGTILDPFAGSGSTGKAAVLEGFGFVGITDQPDHLAIAKRRIAEALAPAPKPQSKGKAKAATASR